MISTVEGCSLSQTKRLQGSSHFSNQGKRDEWLFKVLLQLYTMVVISHTGVKLG